MFDKVGNLLICVITKRNLLQPPDPKNMLKTFEGVVPFVKRLATQTRSIDNWIFKLHYRVTSTILMVATILVCSRQYIGEHIHCIADGGVPGNVLNTYCFFTSTFTLVSRWSSHLRCLKWLLPINTS